MTISHRCVRLASALAGLSLAQCMDVLEPDVGGVRAGLCWPQDSEPQETVSFQDDILPILARETGGCRCHVADAEETIGIQRSGLDLTTYETTLRGGDQSGPDIVVAEDPCASVLVQKLGSEPPFGASMPLDGPPFLTPREQRLISDWIAEGAYDN